MQNGNEMLNRSLRYIKFIVPRTSVAAGQASLAGTPIEQLMGDELPKRNIFMHVSSFVVVPRIVTQSDLIAVIPASTIVQFERKDLLQRCLYRFLLFA